jgi:hypothetical protein
MIERIFFQPFRRRLRKFVKSSIWITDIVDSLIIYCWMSDKSEWRTSTGISDRPVSLIPLS